MFDEAKLDWKNVGKSNVTARALAQKGYAAGELKRRLDKAVEAMEKACRWSRNAFNRLRAMNDAGKLSLEGTEAMRTLFDNIKARLHHAHRYIICYTTHTPM